MLPVWFVTRRVKDLTSTFSQVDKLERMNKEMEQTVLTLETK